MTPQRRSDDPRPDVDAQEVEDFFGTLPKVIAGLETGRKQNRRLGRQSRVIAVVFALLALFLSYNDDRQRSALADSQRMDRVRAERICDDLTDNARKFNKLIDTIVLRTKQSTTITPAQKRQALRLYGESRQTLPVCHPAGEKP